MSTRAKFNIGETVLVISKTNPNYGMAFEIKKIFEGLKNTMARYSSYMLYDKTAHVPQSYMYGDSSGVFYEEHEIQRRF